MRTEYHSIWLMPCLEHENRLQAIIQDLAGLFDSPVFQPHLTLVEDMPRACEELKPLLQQVADGVASFDVRVEGVEESPLYYRSFYARFPVADPLREMKQRAVELFRVGSVETFMPHISLAYGVQESAEKSKAIASLQGALQSRNVQFNRVCIVSSSQHTPIEDWTIRYDIQLRN
jgi:2'-5' RNA ligase